MDSFGKSNDAENVKHERVDCGDKNKFMCACGKVYDFHRSLTSHIECKTISYTCPHCSKVLLTRVGLRKHLDNQVCTRGISDDDDDDYSSLTSHIQCKTISNTCPHCSKVFASLLGLKYHLDNRVCRKAISYDDDDDDEEDDDELILGNKRSSSSNSSSRKSPSRSPSIPSSGRGIIIISL